MKRIIALLLCVALTVAFTACGKGADTDKGADSTTTTTTTVTTTVGEGDTTTTTASDATITTTAIDTDATGGDATASAPSADGSTTATTTVTTTTAGTTTGADAEEPVGSTATITVTPPTTSTTATTVTTTTTSSVVQAKVTLPDVGTDIDVVNKKNRIRVSAATAAYNADGSIAVTLTFKNYSSWITEETDYVMYTCYDKKGNVVQQATRISIGCIDTKKNSVRAFTFTVPAATAEVRLTDSKIAYWTEWS